MAVEDGLKALEGLQSSGTTADGEHTPLGAADALLRDVEAADGPPVGSKTNLGSGSSRQQTDGGSSGGSWAGRSSSNSCKAVKPLPLQLSNPRSNRSVSAVGPGAAGAGGTAANLPSPASTPAAPAANACGANSKLSACVGPETGNKKIAAAVMSEMYGDLLAELGCGSEEGDDLLLVEVAPPAALAAGAGASMLAGTAADVVAAAPSDNLLQDRRLPCGVPGQQQPCNSSSAVAGVWPPHQQ
eukprot:gene13241-13371_t